MATCVCATSNFSEKAIRAPILPGAQFSHSTFHLEKPTVTIVIRTVTNGEARPQYTYLKPFVAYDPFARRDLLTRQLALLDLLHAVSKDEYLRYVRELLSRADLETTFWLLDQCNRRLDASEFVLLLESAEARLGDAIARFSAVFQETRRMESINSRCRLVDQPEHRLLLALLLGLPDRTAILRFLAASATRSRRN